MDQKLRLQIVNESGEVLASDEILLEHALEAQDKFGAYGVMGTLPIPGEEHFEIQYDLACHFRLARRETSAEVAERWAKDRGSFSSKVGVNVPAANDA
jgi:hypothetical protein